MMRMSTFRLSAVMVSVAALLPACSHTRVVKPPRDAAPGRTVGAPAAPAVRVSQPKYGATVVVQRGQTVYRIATENGITPLDLALWNDIPPPYTIYPGQRLRLYPRDGRAPASASPPRSSAQEGAPPAPAPRPGAAPTPGSAPSEASRLTWQWPADGEVVSTYAAGDPTRQGVDIAGKAGQPVRAAADGVVVYSGSGLVGYGELIIVKHNDQWLSAYGHNRARLVNEGALVKAGQQIAEMGRSGATRDMLHFEIRYNGKPVDPLQYLPRR
ncbi:peptidoglycan DD-metalloendopeptidase family protein [Thermomonas alba]|uniref:peptidoglycan DD-metalloendopeptidase family protein n=1 Tax=Thermomonas alba TaxID=2888525 RepID=UPI001F049865|nr:peptidoglycan DD-metalloendopeptidase family protein [Thermomonas alba]